VERSPDLTTTLPPPPPPPPPMSRPLFHNIIDLYNEAPLASGGAGGGRPSGGGAALSRTPRPPSSPDGRRRSKSEWKQAKSWNPRAVEQCWPDHCAFNMKVSYLWPQYCTRCCI
jgi:hypothetical protein